MAASDDLRKLSDRAKTAEDHAAAARNQARAELEQSVTNVRDSAEAEATKLQAKTQAAGQRARFVDYHTVAEEREVPCCRQAARSGADNQYTLAGRRTICRGTARPRGC